MKQNIAPKFQKYVLQVILAAILDLLKCPNKIIEWINYSSQIVNTIQMMKLGKTGLEFAMN